VKLSPRGINVRKIPVALQVYTVRDYAKNDFRGTMLKVKDRIYWQEPY
jgi:hypothetical protein